MNHLVISFYKYTKLQVPEDVRETLRSLCQSRSILGRILIAEEGVNGAICGTKEDIVKFQQKIKEISFFSDLTYREQDVSHQVYHKLVVKVRKEIVYFGVPVSFAKEGTHLSPQNLKKWYDTNEDFVIVDARNAHESEVGKFKDAIPLQIKTFREFPNQLKNLKQHKEKKIVLYCTGGIRCEKASAYLKEQGFADVYQLDGGIVNYVNQFPNTYWQGGLFVFDDRLVSEIEEPITFCQFCEAACEKYTNCHNLTCDKLFIGCEKCLREMQSCCSSDCREAPRKRQVKKVPKLSIGKIENYFAQKNVALVKVEKGTIEINKNIFIEGKTTSFSQQVNSLRDFNGKEIDVAQEGELVTFPVLQKVRKNDLVCVE